jgi:hypothetical protein
MKDLYLVKFRNKYCSVVSKRVVWFFANFWKCDSFVL